MNTVRQLLPFFLLVGFFACHRQPQADNASGSVAGLPQRTTQLSTQAISKLDSVQVDFQLRERCYAYSSEKNGEPSNGEAHSENLPAAVDSTFPKTGFYLVLNQQEYTVLDSLFLGCKLYLVNTTDSAVTLDASDSRLYIVAEALDRYSRWVPITYLPASWCGNSYHTVVLDKNEYWSFVVPIFKGKIKTQLRYTLKLSKEREISSNAVVAYLNPGQFDESRKQKHSSGNIMNPYPE